MRLGSMQLRGGITRYACRGAYDRFPNRIYRHNTSGSGVYVSSDHGYCSESELFDDCNQRLTRGDVAHKLKQWRKGIG
jgi:hypothetical protein